MIDRQRLNEELDRLRRLIRSDPRILPLVDQNADGSIDGQEWERARQCVIRRLEMELAEAARAPAVPAGKVARQVYEEELCTLEPIGPPPQIDATDHIILEWPLRTVRELRRIPQMTYKLRSGADRSEMGEFEQLLTYRDARSRRRRKSEDVEVPYSIRPVEGEHKSVIRRPTFFGETLDVCSVYGRTIAHVKPRSFGLSYGYTVRGEDGGFVTVARRPWNEDCERGWRRTNGERKVPRSPELPKPYHIVDDEDRFAGFLESEFYLPNPKKPKDCYRQWIVRLEPDRLTSPLRWGLIGTLAFIRRRPSLLLGRIWYFFDA